MNKAILIKNKKQKVMLPRPKERTLHLLIGHFTSMVSFLAKTLPVSYRELNHWEKIGLINSSREKSTQWRRFSFIETVWIYIIVELRCYGLPLKNLIGIRENLIGRANYEREKDNHLFEDILQQRFIFETDIASAISRKPVTYKIYSNDEIERVYDNKIGDINKNTTSFLLINLNAVIKDMFVKNDIDPVVNPSVNLTNDERKIILLLRKDKFKEVKITFNNGNADLFITTQFLNVDKRVFEILREHKYQEIKIIQDNGRVVALKRIVKEKIAD